MNIGLLTPSFFPIRGGTEQIVFEVARRTPRLEGHKSFVITPKIKSSAWSEIIDGVKVYRFPFINLPIINALSAQLVLLFYLPYLIRKEKIQLLHMYHAYNLGGAAVIVKWFMRIPLVTYLVGWDTYDPIRPIPKVLWPYQAWVMNHSDAVLTSCQSMYKHAREQGSKKEMPIITHGTNMSRFALQQFSIKQRHHIPDDHKIVLSLQRLAPRKGLQYLIQAIPTVLESLPHVTFVIGGKGSERENLENLAKELGVSDHVVFAGFVSDKDLKNYYAQCDAFTLPSLYEGFGIVYVDALMNGKPIVATVCGGPEDIVTPRNGFLVPTRDSPALAKALIETLTRKWDAQTISQEAQKYDWDNVYKQYYEVYRNLLTQ